MTANVSKPYFASGSGIEVSSGAMVGTGSSATNVNSGAALSGSGAFATNESTAVITGIGRYTEAVGATSGFDKVTTFGVTLGGNESVTAGGILTLTNDSGSITNVGSFQNGSFEGNVKVVK